MADRTEVVRRKPAPADLSGPDHEVAGRSMATIAIAPKNGVTKDSISKRKRASGAALRNPGQHELAEERSATAWRLRTSGMSYPQIAAEMKLSVNSVYNLVQSRLNDWQDQRNLHIDEYVTIQLARYEEIYEGVRPWAVAGDDKSARVAIKVLENEAKLLGLYKQPDANDASPLGFLGGGGTGGGTVNFNLFDRASVVALAQALQAQGRSLPEPRNIIDGTD